MSKNMYIALDIILFLVALFLFGYININGTTIDKPVLYLYPEKETNVKVYFENNNLLTTTYPKFRNSWNLRVLPDGSMYDENNNYYYALYWEEIPTKIVDFSTGFYVNSNNAIQFLEDKLSLIGLNDRERNEFIMYWLPILENNNHSLVYFELTDEKQENNKLIIEPTPDSLLRLTMHVKRVNKKVNIKQQKINTFERKGFIAVEWGGINYNK